MDYRKSIRSCLGFAAFFAIMYFVGHGPWYYWLAVGANLAGALVIKLIQIKRSKK